MRKLCNRIMICLCICAAFWGIWLLQNRATLNRELIRFHVVANSDSKADQTVKLQVRDAVLSSIRKDLAQIRSKEEAEMYLKNAIPKLQQIADSVLTEAGFDCSSVISYCKEAFPTRIYETFSLPSGVYDTLRITIGEGQGQNWWCVSFPALCLGSTREAFCETAVSSGIQRNLADTLAYSDEYQVHFFLLDKLGELENYFFTSHDCPNS